MSKTDSHIPKALASLLDACGFPAKNVLDVTFEATARTKWVIAVDRDAASSPFPYATVGGKGIAFFDTLDAALDDSGGLPVAEGSGSFWELLDAMDASRPVSCKPPVTFVGRAGDILMLSAPPHMLLNAEQAAGLKLAARATLTKATKTGEIDKDAVVNMILVPEGVRLFRLVERRGA